MLSLPPPPLKQTKNSPPTQILLSKQPMIKKPDPALDQQPMIRKLDQAPEPLIGKASKLSTATLLRPPRRTNPLIWLTAVLCVIFSVLLIIAGIATLIIFLSVKPKHPLFDTTVASLNSIYLDSAEYFNGDFMFLANFSNPNRKMDVRFEYVDIELYFFDRLIANQVLQPFTQRRGEARLETVHMISSEVYLPLNLSLELRKQIQSNRVKYNIRGTFRVRASIGLTHFSYWLYGRCQVEMTGPPSGVLVSRSCRTKR